MGYMFNAGAKVHAVFFFNGPPNLYVFLGRGKRPHLKYQTYVFALQKVSCPPSDPRKFIFCFYIKSVSTPFQLKKLFLLTSRSAREQHAWKGVVYWGKE